MTHLDRMKACCTLGVPCESHNRIGGSAACLERVVDAVGGGLDVIVVDSELYAVAVRHLDAPLAVGVGRVVVGVVGRLETSLASSSAVRRSLRRRR